MMTVPTTMMHLLMQLPVTCKYYCYVSNRLLTFTEYLHRPSPQAGKKGKRPLAGKVTVPAKKPKIQGGKNARNLIATPDHSRSASSAPAVASSSSAPAAATSSSARGGGLPRRYASTRAAATASPKK